MKPLPLLVLGLDHWDSWPWAWPRHPRLSRPGAPDKEIEMKALHKMLALAEATKLLRAVVPVIHSSKHAGGHRRPRGWHTTLRRRRKAKKRTRRLHRGQ